jgi:diaminohydroxyphosphoribosylaminopyrimidine deaminase / 5-amino-6-(5-phosphoribosylamino)uracil reductase
MDPSVRDRLHMRRALELAARGLGTVEPNPMVGAVVVRDDRIVGEGWTAPFGGPHAEVVALHRAGSDARGAELFVTLEPCCHFGKTPPCTDAILAAGIRRVVAAVADPFPQVAGKGLAALRDAGVEVVVGICEVEARHQNAAFFKRHLAGMPLVIAKWAMTLDGRIAAASGDSKWISSEESRRRVHEVRSVCDAVIVGAGTALKDKPSLTVRHVDLLPGRRQPTRVILDSQLRVDPSDEPIASARETPVIIYTTAATGPQADALRKAGCELVSVEAATGGVSLRAVLQDLSKRGMSRVLVEGGPTVFASLFTEGLADRVMIFIAPKILASAAAPGPVSPGRSPASPGRSPVLGPDACPEQGRRVRDLASALQVQDLVCEPLGPDILIHGRLGEF